MTHILVRALWFGIATSDVLLCALVLLSSSLNSTASETWRRLVLKYAGKGIFSIAWLSYLLFGKYLDLHVWIAIGLVTAVIRIVWDWMFGLHMVGWLDSRRS